VAGKIRLEIITPYGTIYDDDVNMVIAKGTEGYMGILYDHTPLVTGLVNAPLKIKEEGGEVNIAVDRGFMDVRPGNITILADSAERSDQIDVDRAKAAKERAEARLKIQKDNIDHTRAKAALQRALVRIKVAQNE
jgi:F-type H+-transporting ATPase subunit epsilon